MIKTPTPASARREWGRMTSSPLRIEPVAFEARESCRCPDPCNTNQSRQGNSMITSGSEGMASHIVDEPVRGALGDQQASATGHSGAEAYDRWFESRWGRYAAAIERDTLLRAIGPVEHDLVLDAGCGTGRFSVAMERAGARVVGLDIDMDMLAI